MFLAGRGEEARSFLSIDWCSSPFAYTQNWVHNQLYLGEADERAGDTASACAHYAKVIERWGHAKRRSVTLDEARAHAGKLGCPVTIQ